MKLSVIIVSYNTKALLEKCLESVVSSGHPEFSSGSSHKQQMPKLVRHDKVEVEVIVVDNASSDGSVEMLTTNFPPIKIIRNDTNNGYSAANNQGIKQAKGEYILLLNSDTEVTPTALEELVKFMDNYPKAGIASAQLLNPDGSIQPSGGYLPRLSNVAAWMLFIDDLPLLKSIIPAYHVNTPNFYATTHQVGWAQGAAMIIRRNAIQEIGPLDENIFMYGEDVELCLRSQQAHWQVWTVAQAQVIHHGFQSSSGVSTNAILGEYKGLLYLYKKHKPFWELPLLKLLLKLGAAIRMLIFGTIWRDKQKYAVYKQALSLD